MRSYEDQVELPSGGGLDFSGPALVMAIVNCNEDSFFPSSRAMAALAVEKALAAEEDGAAIVDFGGESTRPGSEYIDAEEELRRLIPVIEAFRKRSKLPVSVDTRKTAVARAALDAGADIVNDISALEDEGMALLCAERGAAVVLMHMKGQPRTMQDAPVYQDVVSEVGAFLLSAAERALAAGIAKEKIILDPGIGFGKRTVDNLSLLAYLAEIRLKGYPMLVGLSRKSFIGEICGRELSERLAGTIAANAAAIMAGADIIRVHDVRQGVDLAALLYAIRKVKR